MTCRNAGSSPYPTAPEKYIEGGKRDFAPDKLLKMYVWEGSEVVVFSCRAGSNIQKDTLICPSQLIPVPSESGRANLNTAIFRSSESVAPTLTLLSLDTREWLP